MSSYAPFVRDVLQRLSADVTAGLLSIRVDGDGRRYVVAAPGAGGRDIVLPAHDDALMVPPRPPPRDPRDLFSPYTIGGVHVPWKAILRNYEKVAARVGNSWARVPYPDEVVVLRLRNDDGAHCYGWFVRLVAAPRKLVMLPLYVAQALGRLMLCDDTLQHSSLCADLWDSRLVHLQPCGNFYQCAVARFKRYRDVVVAATNQRKRNCKRTRPSANSPVPATPAPAHTCVICLDDKASAQPRCRHDGCGARVCDTCHADSRGLCPICDRSALNADYPCSCCNRLHRLNEYGYPCVCCCSHSLCLECYGQFGQCVACECTA